MMDLPVEDDFNDILGKAQKGQGLSTEKLSAESGLSEKEIRDARKGIFDEKVVSVLAEALGLKKEAILPIAREEWYPVQPGAIDGFQMISTPFYGLHVNAYLVWDVKTKRAIAFDTGTDATPLIEAIEKCGLKLDTLILTHTHGDHIAGLADVVAKYGCKVLCNSRETDIPAGSEEISYDYSGSFDGVTVSAIETRGHTDGGTSFEISGLSLPLAIVGDALFAGSMGGANTSYAASLAGAKRLLSLDDETVLASGHGPLTTVVQEKAMNCFSPF